ncbi:MAG: EAL domain-containing protein [Chloroflexi bacterium]|nr:EAL domain-containing protein [Chloroflexota bacterium]
MRLPGEASLPAPGHASLGALLRKVPNRRGFWLFVVLIGALLGLMLLAAADSSRRDVWDQAHRSIAAVLGLAVAADSWRSGSRRVRSVRGWIVVAFVAWTVSETLRLVGLGDPSSPLLAISSLLLAGVLVASAGAYLANLRGKVGLREEIAVYLDAAAVCAAVTGLLVAIVGSRADADGAVLLLLIQGGLFLNILGAKLILDLAVLAELRLRGAYAIISGVALIGAGFVGRASVEAQGSAPWIYGALVSAGVLVVAFGTATFTDRVDPGRRYAQLAAGLRGLLPLSAIALSPFLLLVAQQPGTPLWIVLTLDGAVGVMVVTAVVRQTVLLGERNVALRRHRDALAEAERRSKQIEGVEAVGQLLASTGPTQAALDRVVTLLSERFGHESVAIYLWDGSILRHGATRGYPDPLATFDGSQGIIGRVMRTRRAELVPDVRLDPDYLEGKPGVRSEICVPLSADGEFLGTLDVESTGADPLDETDLAAIVAVADQLAGAIALGTERQRVVQEKDFIAAVLDTVGAVVIVCDENGRVVRFNEACAEVSGYSAAELRGLTSFDFLVPPEDLDGVRAKLAALSGEQAALAHENDWIRKDGTRRRLSWTNTAVLDARGTARYTIATGVDITERKRLEEQLAHRALHDPLTGLPNRTLLMDRVGQALTRGRSSNLVGLLFLDVDDFKSINDTLGHATGDRVLREVAARLKTCIRPQDTAARIGGDEFAVLLATLDGEGDAMVVADRIAASLAIPIEVESGDLHVTASIGVATSADEVDGAEMLLRSADLAMYWVKSHGPGRSTVFQPTMFKAAVERRAMESGLRAALDQDEFVVHYQPVVDLTTTARVGAEALLRWRHPERGLLLPGDFLVLAEETGHIIPAGRYVLETACRQARRWQRPGSSLGWVSVNLSARQFQHHGLVEDVERALHDADLAPDRLILEVTESLLMHDTPDTLDKLRGLKDLGVQIAVDDFGTGYSSLSYLRQFPVDILKIDRSFVAGVATDPKQSAFVRAIVALGQSLDLRMVAEGVETARQRDELRRIGCEEAQGYFFAEPMDADALESLESHSNVTRRRPYRSQVA